MSTSVLQQETDYYVEKYCIIFIFTIENILPVRNIGNKNCVGSYGVDKFVVYGESRRLSHF